MADKYLKNVNGQIAEAAATVSGGSASEAGDIVALDAAGKLDPSIMPAGISPDTVTVKVSPVETLAAGDLVNIYSDGMSSRLVRRADAADQQRAHGFVKEAVASGAFATVYKSGTIPGKTNLDPDQGKPLYLGIGGACTTTPPTTPGHISQEIGFVASTTEVAFEPQQPITLA